MSELLRRGKQQWRGMSQDDVDELVKGGLLVPVTIDHEAAHEHAQKFIANLSIDDIHAIVDAASGGNDE